MIREQLIKALKTAKTDIEPGQEVEVGRFRPEDALGISLAYLEVWGDCFPVAHVYDPEDVVRRNATDDQHTVVARTPRGEVIGLAGLFRHAPNPDVYEAGQLMVLKPYRQGSADMRICRKIIRELPSRLGITVIFAEAVCNHPDAQQLIFQEGMHATGLSMECMPSAAFAQEGGVARNVSLLLMFKVGDVKRQAVYIPQEYKEIIEDIYAKLGLEFERGSAKSRTGDTKSEELLLPDAGLARITVNRAGADFQAIIDMAEAKAGSLGLVQMYLDLGDPAAPEAVTMLRKNGFFFGGLLPSWFGSDGLVMQKTPQTPDWEGLHLYGDEAKAMCDYVRLDYEAVNGA